MFDVLYPTGDGQTDYVQLYDLVKNGAASEEQEELLDTLQRIERGVAENNNHRQFYDELGDKVIAGVSLARLYTMLDNIVKLEYSQYLEAKLGAPQ